MKLRLLTTSLAASAALCAAAPHLAAAACTPLATSAAFKSVDGDTSQYSPAPGGGFEVNGQPWTLTGAARIVAGNETLGVKSGFRSLRLPLGSTATSPEFCVDQTKPHFRFAFKVDNAVLGGFVAMVVYRDAAGQVSNVELTSSKRVTLHPTYWQASDNSPLATLLPLASSGQTATVQIKFISVVPGDFVDDLMTKMYGQNPYRDAMLHAQALYQQFYAAAASPFYGVGVSIDSVMVDPYRRG